MFSPYVAFGTSTRPVRDAADDSPPAPLRASAMRTSASARRVDTRPARARRSRCHALEDPHDAGSGQAPNAPWLRNVTSGSRRKSRLNDRASGAGAGSAMVAGYRAVATRLADTGHPIVAVVIPAYNEARWIGRVLDGMPQDPRFEAIVVDDGSDDGTAQEARTHGAAAVLRLERNSGVGAADPHRLALWDRARAPVSRSHGRGLPARRRGPGACARDLAQRHRPTTSRARALRLAAESSGAHGRGASR